jgi:hypothetical protein
VCVLQAAVQRAPLWSCILTFDLRTLSPPQSLLTAEQLVEKFGEFGWCSSLWLSRGRMGGACLSEQRHWDLTWTRHGLV